MEINFPKMEEKIINFWKENNVFKFSIEQRKNSPNFVFYEGPPTANAKPGIHHVLARIFKDVICRYKTMRGFKVLRKAGWDTHGLPVELEIEKKLGLKNKQDIEKFGIAEFNKKCKESVWEYKKEWENLTERIGFWLDMENPYITYDLEYIETVWWIIKQIWQKGLLYKDYKVVPYCPRCGTALSSHEVALGYKKIKENSIFVKLKIKDSKFENSSLLIWTTTPWTLPGNVAVAVNPQIKYIKAKINQEILILAKNRIDSLNIPFEILEEFNGSELVDIEYEPLFLLKNIEGKKTYFAIPGDFVSLEEGTGLVHIAPAFGEEDMQAIKEQNSKLSLKNLPLFPILLTVDQEGRIIKDFNIFGGMFVKEADPLIIESLKKRNLLFKEEIYEHDYPFCWRCDSPLLYYAEESWFINMQKVKNDLIKNNSKINWNPSHLKEGRFGEWLREVKDWALSRERYWGTPLPVWECKSCKKFEVIGSLKELLEKNFSNNKYIVLRHGDSLRQKENVASCWPEVKPRPLTEKGEKEIKKAAEKLKNEKIDIIFSSDILRTKQTAEIVSKETKAEIVFDERIREWNVGIFNNKDVKEVWDHLNQKENMFEEAIPEGESLIDLSKRMYEFIKDIDKKYQNKNILIVSHELPISLLEGSLVGLSAQEALKQRNLNRKDNVHTGEWRKIVFKNLPYNDKMEIDPHRPFVDKVKFYCKYCQGLMEKIPEVLDCWFDSGAMPFAQNHYPFENKELIDKKIQFPADYISEAIDQTRGWFYTLLAISTLLGHQSSYKNVISLGHVLDEKGEKMSKSKGNVVDPWDMVEKYGADAVRWYFYTVNQPGDSKLFSEKGTEEALKKFVFTFWNCYTFFETYSGKLKTNHPETKNILDLWIVSKMNRLISEVTKNLDKYEITGPARLINDFVIEDLSQWYIRRSRKRFHSEGKDFQEVSETLGFVINVLSKLIAPLAPFLSEEVYQNIKSSNLKSVHLENWPSFEKKLIKEDLEKKMEKTREIVALILAERAKAGIKVRQPLKELKIKNTVLKNEKELIELIKEEVNIKEVIFDKKMEKEIELNYEITPELKEEGIIREVIRNIQESRKRENLKPKDEISVYFFTEEDLRDVLNRNKSFIIKEAKVKDFIFIEKENNVLSEKKTIKVDDKIIYFNIKK